MIRPTVSFTQALRLVEKYSLDEFLVGKCEIPRKLTRGYTAERSTGDPNQSVNVGIHSLTERDRQSFIMYLIYLELKRR